MIGCRVVWERLRDAGSGPTRTGSTGATGSTGHAGTGRPGHGLMYGRSMSLRDAGSGPTRTGAPGATGSTGSTGFTGLGRPGQRPCRVGLAGSTGATGPTPGCVAVSSRVSRRRRSRSAGGRSSEPGGVSGLPRRAEQTGATGRGFGTRFRQAPLVPLVPLDAGSTGATGFTGDTGDTGDTGTPGRR